MSEGASRDRIGADGTTLPLTPKRVIAIARDVEQFFAIAINEWTRLSIERGTLMDEWGSSPLTAEGVVAEEAMAKYRRIRLVPPTLRPNAKGRLVVNEAEDDAYVAGLINAEALFRIAAADMAAEASGSRSFRDSEAVLRESLSLQGVLLTDGLRVADALNEVVAGLSLEDAALAAAVSDSWPHDLAALTVLPQLRARPGEVEFQSPAFILFANANQTLLRDGTRGQSRSWLTPRDEDKPAFNTATQLVRFIEGMPVEDFMGDVVIDLHRRAQTRRRIITLQARAEVGGDPTHQQLAKIAGLVIDYIRDASLDRIGAALVVRYGVDRPGLDHAFIGTEVEMIATNERNAEHLRVVSQDRRDSRRYYDATVALRRQLEAVFVEIAELDDKTPPPLDLQTAGYNGRFITENMDPVLRRTHSELASWSGPEIAYALRLHERPDTALASRELASGLDQIYGFMPQRPRALPTVNNTQGWRQLHAIGMDISIYKAIAAINVILENRQEPVITRDEMTTIGDRLNRLFPSSAGDDLRLADIVFLSATDWRLLFGDGTQSGVEKIARFGGFTPVVSPDRERDEHVRDGNELIGNRFIERGSLGGRPIA